jgi:PAS domain S-box-containing protein
MSDQGNTSDIIELIRKLAEIENTLEASVPDQVDVVVDPATSTPLLLRRAQWALIAAKDQLEQEVRERTAELERTVEVLKKEAEERKKAEQALCESAERLRSMAENVPCVLMRFDRQLRVVYLSKQADRYNPNPVERMIGRTNREVGMPEHLCDLWDAAIERVFRTGTQEEMIFDLAGPSGMRTFELKFGPEFSPDHEVQYVLGVSSDITERKKAEEALRKAKDELELRVQERTAELVKAKEAAEAAARTKAAFMANMSHELRTPMNSVIGFTGLLLDESLTNDQREYVESIRDSGQALLALINEILDFSKMDREKMGLELQAFDLRGISEEALDMVAAQAASKGLELNYSFDKNVPEAIIGDPGKLRQVLANLLSNAVKFTKEGEVEVNVSLNPDQDEIHFAVKDTGIGIPEDDLDKLFKPFSQLDLSYSRGFEGTGLGLAISKKLVELMGGRIWIESQIDKGSTFHFAIPEETAPAEPKAFLTGSFKGKQVLIAVENQTLRRILGRQVHAWGIVPMMASKIFDATELLQRDNGFDAVIIDVSNGDVLSKIAEKRDRWKQLSFIALTVLGQKVPPDLFQAVLTKPLKPAKLFSALKDVLEERETSEPVEVFETEKSHGPMRILLAEDNISNQKVTLEMLKKLGYRADAVVNGQEVLEALERQPYDIIFMDVKMPVMNGMQATMEIRKSWPENGPKIIAVTAYALHGDKEKCLAAGMDGYIAKPVQKEDLAEVLEKFR